MAKHGDRLRRAQLSVTVGRREPKLPVPSPGDVVLAAGFENGTPVEVESRQGEGAIPSVPPRYTLDELLEGVTPEAMREAFEWGRDVGREALE